jgi:hypothetical protein
MDINIRHLKESEYFPANMIKDTIYLHHTAGSHRPDLTIDCWNTDRSETGSKVRVSTAYVIGGISTRNLDETYNGKIYEAFESSYWAHHLGVKSKNNTFLNQKSVAIELCNYGPLTKTSDGRYFTYVKSEVPEQFVTKLSKPFRGYSHYHSYTTEQIESLRILLISIGKKFNIDLKKGIQREILRSELVMPSGIGIRDKQIWLNKNGFTDSKGRRLIEDGISGKSTAEAESKIGASPLEFNTNALEGYPGIWSHTSVRTDKSDIFPQPELLLMLKSL